MIRAILSCVLLACASFLIAQPTPSPHQQYGEAVELYQLLKNGRHYGHFYNFTEGKQFLDQRSLRQGSLVYEGVLYQDLNLNYDVFNDLVFVSVFIEDRQSYVIVHPQKIQAFTLEEDLFLNLPENHYPGLAASIYQQLNPDPAPTVLVKRKKNRVSALNNYTQKQYRFEILDVYYLVHEGKVWPVRNKKDVLAVLGETDKVKRLLKRYKLRLRKDPAQFERHLVQIMAAI